MNPPDCRVKSLSIPEHLLLTVVEQMCGSPTSRTVLLPDLGVPPGATVHAVLHRWESRTFEVLVRHPDFAEVPDGDSVPRHPAAPGPQYHTYFLAPLGSPEAPAVTPEFRQAAEVEAATPLAAGRAAGGDAWADLEHEVCPTCDDDRLLAKCLVCGRTRVSPSLDCPCGVRPWDSVGNLTWATVPCPDCQSSKVEIRESSP